MRELADALDVRQEIEDLGLDANDFENSYDKIAREAGLQPLARKIERLARSYFAELVLPDEPTIYDYLVWSLRNKDFIATFNWDPFLYQALKRNNWQSVQPHYGFLHGNAAFDRCETHKVFFEHGMTCSKCKKAEPFPLLYPVAQKDYESDKFIAQEWGNLRLAMTGAYYVTIFGYSAPTTDVAARKIFLDAWRGNQSAELNEVEFINTAPENVIEETWSEFTAGVPRGRIHYSILTAFSESALFRFPRRTCEQLFSRTMMLQPFRDNSFPAGISLDDLQYWGQQLLDAETEAGGHLQKQITDEPCKWPI